MTQLNFVTYGFSAGQDRYRRYCFRPNLYFENDWYRRSPQQSNTVLFLETIFLSRQVLFELKINELKIEKKRSHVAMLLSRRGKIGKIFKC